jgi:Cu(I)/Ag(I) efflux system periplasmic protein CusF
MKSIRTPLFHLLAVASLALPVSLFAATDLSEGTVKKIDAATQRVMLAHGPIANINMPPMTMMFRVKDAALLKPLKDGDKVRFRVEDVDGDYTIVRIEAVR